MMMDEQDLPYQLNGIPVSGGIVFLNPGTGAVKNATEQQAVENMRQFILDATVGGLYFRRVAESDYGDGRFAFLVLRDGFDYVIEIQMPGISLEQVRYLGDEGQNVWHFPRLYKDGSSWVWKYAVIDADDYRTDDE